MEIGVQDVGLALKAFGWFVVAHRTVDLAICFALADEVSNDGLDVCHSQLASRGLS